MTEPDTQRWSPLRGRPDPRIGPSLFIAVPLPDSASERVVELVRAVRRDPDHRDDAPRDPMDVRWVRMDGLHLTVRFLGPTPRERIPAVTAALDVIARTVPPFVVRLAGTGAFPSADRPRTLWLGVADGAPILAALAREFGAALIAEGWPPEDRPFRPHLTLARSDGVRSAPDVVRALERTAAETAFAAEFSADRMILFESRTGAGAARYEPLHETPFVG